MDSLRQHTENNLVDQIVQHFRQHPYAIRHARKVMRHFRATSADLEQAINLYTTPLTLRFDPKETVDKVVLHFLRYPEDMIDMRKVMKQLRASEREVRQALEKLDMYIVEGGEGEVHAGNDKK
jgi:predicted urease superfamily metal-dependent hydrolase